METCQLYGSVTGTVSILVIQSINLYHPHVKVSISVSKLCVLTESQADLKVNLMSSHSPCTQTLLSYYNNHKPKVTVRNHRNCSNAVHHVECTFHILQFINKAVCRWNMSVFSVKQHNYEMRWRCT